jgi:ankyrin repeat protein
MDKLNEIFANYTDKVLEKFLEACKNSDFSTIKYMVNKYHKHNDKFLNKGLIASQHDPIMIKYLTKSPELVNHAHIDLIYACNKGYLGIVQYLLTSPESIQLSKTIKAGFLVACKNGHIDIVKYFLASPELEKPIDFFNSQENAFFAAYENNQKNMVEYLILNVKIKPTREIRRIILRDKDIKTLFEYRRLKAEIDSQPIMNKNDTKRIKL